MGIVAEYTYQLPIIFVIRNYLQNREAVFMTIISKKQMSEEDIKLQYIIPAITAKWDIKKITMETNITDEKINLKGNFVTREKPKRADYVLYLNSNNPIAIVETKDNKHSISHGLQQAMAYASMLDFRLLIVQMETDFLNMIF